MSEVLIVMGVAGSGKSTIGRLLAERLGWEFLDADDFHPPGNIRKLSNGEPLDDADRLPWLTRLAAVVRDHLASGNGLVLACSALKSSYRLLLSGGSSRVRFLFLRAERELIASRLAGRQAHFMSSGLLDSQFAALEEPSEAVVVDASKSAGAVVDEALARLGLAPGS